MAVGYELMRKLIGMSNLTLLSKSAVRNAATLLLSLSLSLPLWAQNSFAGDVDITVNKISVDGIGAVIGSITLKDADHGMMVVPNLRGLAPGGHAFHIHENPDCGAGTKGGKKVAGLKAGGHFSPGGMAHGKKHGHGAKHGEGTKHGDKMKPRGDLPQLTADADGTATTPVMTKLLKVGDVRGRAIMVHRYGDSDPGKPKGGGPRFACGVIPQ